MSEIEKLYKNAGIEKHITCNHVNCPQYGAFGRDKCAIKTRIATEECIKNKEYTTAEYVYPPFTAKKQLELIKWLIQEVDNLQLWHFCGKGEAFDFDLGRINAKGATFEETLASLINTLWHDLTDEEAKAEIKEILCE